MPFCIVLTRSRGSGLNMAAIGPRTAHVLSPHVLQGPENGSTGDHRPRSLGFWLPVSQFLTGYQIHVSLMLCSRYGCNLMSFGTPLPPNYISLQVYLTSDLPSVFPHPSLRSQNIVLSSQSFYLLIISICLLAHRTLSFRGLSAGVVLFIVPCGPHAWREARAPDLLCKE